MSAAQDAVAELPSPSRGPDSVEVWPTLWGHAPSPELREAMEARHRLGIERYGQPLVTFDGRDTDVDMFQEALDLAVYAQKDWLELGGDGICPLSRMVLGIIEEMRRFRAEAGR